MTREEFKAKCLAAIQPYHDPKEDGPLLISTIEQTAFDARIEQWTEPHTEYAASIGNWPLGYFGEPAPEYDQFTSDVVVGLTQQARGLWQARQPEPDDEHDSEPSDPFAGTAWSTGR